MNKQMKQHLETVVNSIVNEDAEAAKASFHEYLRMKTQAILLGEAEDDEAEDDDAKDDEAKDDEAKDKDEKKSKKTNPFAKDGEDDEDKDDEAKDKDEKKSKKSAK